MATNNRNNLVLFFVWSGNYVQVAPGHFTRKGFCIAWNGAINLMLTLDKYGIQYKSVTQVK